MLRKRGLAHGSFVLVCILACLSAPVPAYAQSEREVDARITHNLGNPGEYRAFFKKFKQAVVSGDKQTVAGMLRYPVRATGLDMHIATAETFIAHYDEIFTPKVVAAVREQSYADLFVRDQGVMIGNGEVWFTGVCADKACARRAIKVVTVNN